MYDSIKQPCTIANTGGGKVGVAITANAPKWVEVNGAFGSARITITKSSHYQAARFHNHFDADNVDLTFGQMAKGEKGFIKGIIEIFPNTNDTPSKPSTLFFQAEDMHHQVGRRDGNGWSVNARDVANRYLSYGPYTRDVAAGKRTATFRLQVDNVTADNNRLLTLDVYDADSGRVLATKHIHRREFMSTFAYQNFDLNFEAIAGHRLEFRTFSHGGSYVKQDFVAVR